MKAYVQEQNGMMNVIEKYEKVMLKGQGGD